MSTRKQELRIAEADGCPMYKPCPICFSCENKAVHLYEACQNCPVPIDHHNHTGKAWMIKRENFEITVTPETRKAFDELAEVVHAKV